MLKRRGFLFVSVSFVLFYDVFALTVERFALNQVNYSPSTKTHKAWTGFNFFANIFF